MKKIIIIAAFFSSFLSTVSAQKTSGYLGKRILLGGEIGYGPVLNLPSEITNMKYRDNSGKEAKFLSSNLKIGAKLGYVISRRSVLMLNYNHFRTGFYIRIDTYDYPDNYFTTSGEERFTYPVSLSNNEFNGTIEFSFDKNLPAQMGKYYSLGLSILQTKQKDFDNILYGTNGKISQQIGLNLSDPKYTHIKPYITTGFGNRQTIAGKVVLDFGFRASFNASFIKGALNLDDKNSTDEKYFIEDENESETESIAREFDFYTKKGMDKRIQNFMSFNLYIGILGIL
jgi:hypothetical protein